MSENILKLLQSVKRNTSGDFGRQPVPCFLLPKILGNIVGIEGCVHLSEFVVAKVKGRIQSLNAHPEIADDDFLQLPGIVSDPHLVLMDDSSRRKRYFIGGTPTLRIVIEIDRPESGVTEISTIHVIGIEKLKKLESKHPVLYRRDEGGTAKPLNDAP